MRRVRTIARGDRSLERRRWTLLLQRLLCEAETVESPSLIPSLTEDASARIGAMTSRARIW